MTPEILTLKLLLGNLGYSLGWHAVVKKSAERKHLSYTRGTDDGCIMTCVRSMRDILRAHPQLRREAARWIKAGIAGAK